MNKSKSPNTSRNSCERFVKHTQKHPENTRLNRPFKKVVVSDKRTHSCIPTTSHIKPEIVKPKKTTSSEACYTRKKTLKPYSDHCTSCDSFTVPSLTEVPTYMEESSAAAESIKSKKKTKKQKNPNANVKQYYKNENFKQTSDSAEDIDADKKRSLPTIKEVSERTETESNRDEIGPYTSESGEEYLDTDDSDSIKKLKEFRRKNYFECHSATSRIKMKPSVTSLNDHKCSYRFYLNERLFAVPLNSDYNNEIRCVECHLPFQRTEDLNQDVNGVIQAKVKFGTGDKVQDILLILPVKEPLIIKQKKKELEVDKEVVYFGIVKLSQTGYSMFNKNHPNNSLALKYQKGYREKEICNFGYDEVDAGDVIII